MLTTPYSHQATAYLNALPEGGRKVGRWKEKELLTWNEAVKAEMTWYVVSQGCPRSGRNGVNIYWRPSRGTRSSVALQKAVWVL